MLDLPQCRVAGNEERIHADRDKSEVSFSVSMPPPVGGWRPLSGELWRLSGSWPNGGRGDSVRASLGEGGTFRDEKIYFRHCC